MITRSIVLRSKVDPEDFEQLCDMLRAVDMYLDSYLDSDGKYHITVQFLNEKHLRVFQARLNAQAK